MIKENEVVPLNVQLYDGATDKIVKVRVQNESLETVFTGELAHTFDGLYRSNELRMPLTDFLIATYIVFDGEKESKNYERSTDLFERDKSIEFIQAVVEQATPKKSAPEFFYVATVVTESDGFMEGTVTSEKLISRVIDQNHNKYDNEPKDDDDFMEGVIDGIFEAQAS